MKSLTYTATISNGDAPDAVPLNQKFSDIQTFITGKLDPDNIVNGTQNQVIICNASGVPQYGTIPGGSIQNGAITTPKLADLAVTGPKLNLNQISGNIVSSDTAIGGSHTFTLTTPSAGTYMLYLHAQYDTNGGNSSPVTNQIVVGITPLGTRFVVSSGAIGTLAGDSLMEIVTVDGSTAVSFNVAEFGTGGILKGGGMSYYRFIQIG